MGEQGLEAFRFPWLSEGDSPYRVARRSRKMPGDIVASALLLCTVSRAVDGPFWDQRRLSMLTQPG